MMDYKGYLGKVEYDDEAALFHGEVVNTRDVITFQGKSVAELKKSFRNSVNDYLAFCAERGEEPDKPFSGQFVARVSPELHRQASFAASLAGKSLNAWVTEQLQMALGRHQTAVAKPVKRSSARRTKSNGKRSSKRSGGSR